MPKSSSVNFGGPSKYDVERKRRMAEMLIQQGKQPEQTEMVSGWAVPQSTLAGLAKALQTGLGGYQQAKADEMEQQRQNAARNTYASAMEAYNRSQDTTPTQLQSGETINWNKPSLDQSGKAYASILMQNEDTAPLAMQAMQSNMEMAQRAAREDELMKQRQAFEMSMLDKRAAYDRQMTPYQAAMLQMQKDELAKLGQITPYQQKQIELEQQKIDAMKTKGIDPATGQPIRKMSASEQKEIFDIQEKSDAVAGAISALQQAQSIMSRPEGGPEAQPYSGYGADFLTSAATIPYVGGLIADKDRAAATTEAKNLITDQALSNMKAIFGGNPTEGERAVLLQLQALPTYTPEQQKVIIDNALEAANRRLGNFNNRLSQIETGQYFTPTMTPNMLNTPNSPQNIGAQGQGSNPALTTPYDQITPVLQGGGDAPLTPQEMQELQQLKAKYGK